MAKRQEIPDIFAQARQQVDVLGDVLSGRPLGTWPKEVDYPIEKIIIGKRLRPVKDVTELAASMAESGLLQRIVLLPDGTLVVGGHRVAAAKQLGWTTIPARIAELDEVDAELAEIDENLYRRELTVLEQAEHLQRRMELLEIKGQRAKAGDNQHSDATTTAAVADSIGISERSAQQRLQIARGLSQAARDALRDTDLAQSTTKLLDLAKQPQEYQVAIIGKMVNEGYLNVDAAASTVIPYKVAPDPELLAQGERSEAARLAYMEENGRRNEEYFAKMRADLEAAKAQSTPARDLSYDAWCKQTDKRCTCDGMLFLSTHVEDKDAHGVITNARIECYCSTCNGTQTWKANQEKGWYLVRSTTEHPVPPAAEEPPADDYPSIAMVEDPAPSVQRAPATVLNGGRIVPGRAYQSVDQLIEEVRICARQHYIEPHERARAASDMHASAGARAGGFWKFVTTQTANYTQMDLVNAIHKVADEVAAGIYVWDLDAKTEEPAAAPAGTVDDEEQPLKLATVADDDAALDILAPDRKEPSSPAQKRNERIDRVTLALNAALAAANEFEDVTGAYTLTPALRRAIEPMLKALEGNRV